MSYVGPLDLVSSAAAAYSVRALSSARRGQNIFRLLRDSDQTEMDFAADSTTGDAPTAAIATWLNGATGLLVKWYDQSGNGRDFILVQGNQIPYHANLFGGRCGFFAVSCQTEEFSLSADAFVGLFVSNIPLVRFEDESNHYLRMQTGWNATNDPWVKVRDGSASVDWASESSGPSDAIHFYSIGMSADGLSATASVDGSNVPLAIKDEAAVAPPAITGRLKRHSGLYDQEIIFYSGRDEADNAHANIMTYYSIS